MKVGVLLACLLSLACSRKADLVDEPDVGVKPPTILDKPDAEIPILDAGLGSDAFSACEERPQGQCLGPNDFPCEFSKWALDIARTCQRETSCFTNGWLTVHMDDFGCVDSIAMDQPNDEMVACLVEAYGGFQCPCQEEEVSYFFGIGNDGGCPDAGGPDG